MYIDRRLKIVLGPNLILGPRVPPGPGPARAGWDPDPGRVGPGPAR